MRTNRQMIMFLLATTAFPAASFAQEAAKQPAEEQTGKTPLSSGEIIVTANRRSESIQKVAASVMALNGEQLENLGVQSAGDLAELIPNVDFKKQ